MILFSQCTMKSSTGILNQTISMPLIFKWMKCISGASVPNAENFLRKLGLEEFRVRDYGDCARLEVLPKDMSFVVHHETRQQIISYLTSCGYCHIELDLKGLRSGSLNEELRNKELKSSCVSSHFQPLSERVDEAIDHNA